MKRPSIHPTFWIVCCFLLALSNLACQQPVPEAPSSLSAEEAAEPSSTGPEDVTYEPAYPEDVSTEGLDADDTAQQHSHSGNTHSHGDEEHSHGDEDHAHGHDHAHGDEHDHDEGEHDHEGGEHSHEGGEHSHGDGDEHEH